MPTGKTPKDSGQSDMRMLISFIIMAVIFTSVLNIFMSAMTTRKATEITYTEFWQML